MCRYKKQYELMKHENQRNYIKYQLLYQWMRLSLTEIRLREFFEEAHLDSLAVYGMGELGKLFYDDILCQNCGSWVRYGIDKQTQADYRGLKVYPLDALPEKVQAIVISPVLITDEIEDAIYEKLGEQRTFTIEEILYELSRKHGIQSALWNL